MHCTVWHQNFRYFTLHRSTVRYSRLGFYCVSYSPVTVTLHLVLPKSSFSAFVKKNLLSCKASFCWNFWSITGAFLWKVKSTAQFMTTYYRGGWALFWVCGDGGVISDLWELRLRPHTAPTKPMNHNVQASPKSSGLSLLLHDHFCFILVMVKCDHWSWPHSYQPNVMQWITIFAFSSSKSS